MRITERLRRSIAIIIAAIGLLSSLITTLTANFNKHSIEIGVILLVASILIILVILYFLPKESLPSGLDSVTDALANDHGDQKIKIIFPCDRFYYKAANALAIEKFGKKGANISAAEDWQKRNEYILTCLCDHNMMVGYFDILPLKPEFAKRFIDGDAREKDIRAEHLYAFHDIKKVEYVYFAGIAVKNTSVGAGCIYATYLIYAAILYLKTFYAENNITVLTTPTSDQGLAITKKFFNLEREGELRKDKLDLYAANFNAAVYTQIMKQSKGVYKRFDSSAYKNLLNAAN
ncbi:MAG: hypothetical protein JWQ79_3170 [Mucilaginibacter sp.]|nr:hypothetical protein [Mucilaginibacter sp.]